MKRPASSSLLQLVLVALVLAGASSGASSQHSGLRRGPQLTQNQRASRQRLVRDAVSRAAANPSPKVGALASLDKLDAFLQLEALHSSHHAASAPSSWNLGGDFGCTFRTYWETILKSCKDGSMKREVESTTSSTSGISTVQDVLKFCEQLANACETRGDDQSGAEGGSTSSGSESSSETLNPCGQYSGKSSCNECCERPFCGFNGKTERKVVGLMGRKACAKLWQ